MAAGLYDPDSMIRIRLLQFKKPAEINQEWFKIRISEAFDLRKPLFETDTNSYRLIYGENDGLPGLIVDVYAQVAVVKLYTRAWLPHLNHLLPIIQSVSNTKVGVLRLSRNIQRAVHQSIGWKDGTILYGDLESNTVLFQEHGLTFEANVIEGHKTGYFLDHRHNRHRVSQMAGGKSVLDVFAYAGGFSVHALAGGATRVVSLDISAQALSSAERNVALNFSEANHEIMAIDAFEGLQQLNFQEETFDIVVVDPPSFAKKATEVDKALQSYRNLVKLAIPLVRNGGHLVMASCSSRISKEVFFSLVEETFNESGSTFLPFAQTFHDVDHPVTFPEGAYLKCGYYQLK